MCPVYSVTYVPGLYSHVGQPLLAAAAFQAASKFQTQHPYFFKIAI
jgi:hypothetical protein